MISAVLAAVLLQAAPLPGAPAAPPAPTQASPAQHETAPSRRKTRARRNLRCEPGCLTPIEAVTYASYLGDKAGVAATFDMHVRAVGASDGRIYLNSEDDYRDRNCLSVAIPEQAAEAMFGTHDLSEIREKVEQHRILVRGIARQVRINFIADGKPSGKYYYQVQVFAGRRDQLRILT